MCLIYEALDQINHSYRYKNVKKLMSKCTVSTHNVMTVTVIV